MSTEDPTAAELLTAVNAAILDIVAKKFSSTTVNGQTYTRQDLGQLREMRKELKKEVRSGSNSSVRLADISGVY